MANSPSDSLAMIQSLTKGLGPLRIMEFCGGHTHALVRSGILDLLPPQIKMVHGPGCPVCVLPPHHLQAVIDLLAENSNLTAAVYGDLMRIPTLGGQSLVQAKSRGLSVKMIYSPLELLTLAEKNSEREFLFVAIGFETTAPATAILLKKLKQKKLKNVSVFCLHVLTPPAIAAVMENLEPLERPQAILGPGHVSLVTGIDLYPSVAALYKVPVVVSGFEAQDLLESLALAVCAISKQNYSVINQYARALRPGTQQVATSLLKEIFDLRKSFAWRGLGELKNSAYCLREDWADFDAEKKYRLNYREVPEHPACQCGEILKGKKAPRDCRLFRKACHPTRPLGACMVSSEGACNAYFQTEVGL